MSLTLSKTIPARTKTITADWLRMEFQPMSQQFRRIRARFVYKMDRCFWCDHKFKDGEMMALVSISKPKGIGNKALCQECATEMSANDQEPR